MLRCRPGSGGKGPWYSRGRAGHVHADACKHTALFIARLRLRLTHHPLEQDITYRLGRLPQLTLSLLEGAAIGGGAELATATDWRFMHHNAVIQFVHARMGVSPGTVRAERVCRM